MNIPATFGPICFSGSLEEDWNVYGRTDGRTDDGRQVMAIAHMTLRVRWAKNLSIQDLKWKFKIVDVGPFWAHL